MPSLSKIFRSSDKEKEALAESELRRQNTSLSTASSSSPPPTYDEAPPDYDEDYQLDNPSHLTAGFSKLTLDDAATADMALPTVDETIAQLKVLEAFFRLRQSVGRRDGAFGIRDEIVAMGMSESIDEQSRGNLLAKLAEKRWAVYIARAVDRFDRWLETVAPTDRPSIAEYEKDGSSGAVVKPTFSNKKPIALNRTNMPPLDVLMVWHAYMLNPRAYLEDCIRHGRMQLWNTRFPWRAATDCIESETFAYTADAESAWTKSTGLPWDNFDGGEKIVNCISCQRDVEVPWTLWEVGKDFVASETAIDMILADGNGFCDRNFSVTCPGCQAQIRHEILAAGKFLADLRHLVGPENAPMAGTLLSNSGLPLRVGKQTDEIVHKTAFRTVNNLFQCGLGKKILASPKLSGNGAACTMKDIRATVEVVMTTDKTYMKAVRGAHSYRMTRAEKIVFRKMMSRYWDNSSPFALDLVGAVIRQGSFIEKMHNIDWLHSPALPSTMSRLLTKYERFMQLMSNSSYNMAVPTLDVDLAWHTHQLNPAAYLQYTVRTTLQFIDHDDKVAETKLNDAFAWTSKTYQKMFGEPYSECTCWYCEAIRESHTSSASRLFSSNTAKANDLVHDVDQDPMKSVHISAHNAVRPTDTAKYTADAAEKARKLEQAYAKACERAKKKGKKEPRRDDYYYSTAWGYPVYIPAYSPYVGYMPYTPIYYPVMPGCMALAAGAAGNCAAGTCGGGVAAGACSAGGCAGGVAGGCGGGAGGGGGGGCGGGGGGGGGCGGGGGGGC